MDDRQQETERLYKQAFEDLGALALWSSRPVPCPTAGDALAITYSLRCEGNMSSRRLAEKIERLRRDAA